MKIEIHNLGPIHRFDFDLEKDLHVIYGENSVGKSYAVNFVYILLKNIVNTCNINSYGHNDDYKFVKKEDFKELENKIITKLKKNDSIKINLREEIEEVIKLLFQEIVLNAVTDSFQNIYTSSFRNKYNKDSSEIRMQLNDTEFIFTVSKENKFYMQDFSFKKDIHIEGEFSTQKTMRSLFYTIYIDGQDKFMSSEDTFVTSIYEHFIEEIFSEFIVDIGGLFFLPASRSGLYNALNALTPIIVELSQNRKLIKGKIELPNLSEPVADYF